MNLDVFSSLNSEEKMRFAWELVHVFSSVKMKTSELLRFCFRESLGEHRLPVWGNTSNTFHCTGDINFWLYYEEMLLCAIWVLKDGTVVQIQGAKIEGKTHNNFLKKFQWPKVLLVYAKQYFQEKFHIDIQVGSSASNFWYDLSGGGPEHGAKIYDIPARELGIPIVEIEYI